MELDNIGHQDFNIKYYKNCRIFGLGAMTSSDPSIRRVTKWFWAIWQSSTLLGAAMIGLIWISLSVHLEAERNAAERAAIQVSDNLSRAFVRNVSDFLSEIDRLLTVMGRNYVLHPDAFRFGDWLSIGRFSDSGVFQFGIAGADGLVKLSTTAAVLERRTNLTDREHFQVHVNASDKELFISKPVIGQTTGRLTLQLTRRIDNADGSFGGVIIASVDPSYFSRFYDTLDLGSNGRIRIVGNDGIVRAVGGGVSETPGANLSAGALFKSYPKTLAGWYRSPSSLSDNVSRLLFYRAIDGYPLVVTVSVSTDEILSHVNAKQRAYQLIAATLTFLILAVTGFSIRGRMALDVISDRLQSQNLRFDMAMRNMSQGLCMFDERKRLVVCNDRYAEIYRLPPELREIGTPQGAIIAHRVTEGLLRGGKSENDVRRKLTELSELPDNDTSSRIDELADGRLICITRNPMGDGGWVATHEDVTKQKRAEMELDRARRFLDTVIENIPLPIVVKEPDSQNILLVNQAFEKFIGLSRDVVIGHSAGALFSKEKADLIAKCDIEAVEAGQIVVSANLELDTAQSGLRNVTTTRLVVRDGGGKPQCLIVVIQDETEKKKAEQRLAFMAHHDALTGLANRAALLEKLEEASARQRRWGEPFSVLLLDIDRFKSVNDTLGHPAGDALLQEVSGQLRSSLRETDVLARLGGDEFAIIQAGENDPRQGATVLANRILEIVAKPFDINGNQLAIGASIGIAMAPEHGNSPDALLKMADLALYRVKSNGRNGFCFFEHEMSEASNARHLLEADLRSAISRNELELHYQPIVDTRTRKLCGVEALVRWRHPQRGLVFPDQFIALAEETSLITQIGEWVLQTACADAATWPPFVRVAVNLSPVQFRKSNLVETVTCALAKAGVPPERLELEITESALIDNATQCAATLHQLKTLGVTIALDDFGTGYSSLSQLTMFPFDRIKIDKSFTSNMTKRADCAAIVSAALTLAHSLDIATTAEGVETTEQLKLLRLAGVGAVQGYLFARPCPLPHVDFNRIYGDQALDDAA